MSRSLKKNARGGIATKNAPAFLGGAILLAAITLASPSQREPSAHLITPVAVEDYRALTQDFVAAYQVAQKDGVAVCRPPAGADIYLQASRWKWEPALILEAGQSYNLHLSSLDVNHGFSFQGYSLAISPGSAQVMRLKAEQEGEFRITCDEFCGAGHELMSGTIVVKD